MTFLKRLGSILLQVSGVVAGFGPISFGGNSNVAKVINELDKIAQIVVQVEAFGQALSLPGNQKLLAASGPVAQVILQSSFMSGHKIANEQLFKDSCQKIADGMAGVLNSLHEASLSVENKIA